MKKKYLLILGLSLATLSFGQEGFKPKSQKVKAMTARPEKNFSTEFKNPKVGTSNQTEKAGGDLIWGSDFSNPADWTLDNSGQTAATFGWDIGSTTEGWFWGGSVISSTSGGNFAELGNGDAQAGTQALDVVYTMTTANPIPLTTTTNVTLNFLQWGARFNDAQEIYVSTDNLTWVLVGDNTDFDVLSSAGGSEYPNPSAKSIVLGNIIAPGSTQLYVRFSWTTAFPSSSTNPNVWIAYGWLIDDVQVVETYADDLKLSKVIFGANSGSEIIPYYKTPVAQVQPIEFGGIIENKGFAAKNDVVFKADITASSYAGVSAATALAGYASDTVFVANTFNPTSSPAVYNVSGFEVMSAVENVPVDNTAANLSFEVTNYIYARDKNVKDGTADDGANEFKLCNQFDVYADQNLFGVDFFVDPTSATDALVTVTVRDINTTAFDGLAFSSDYNLKASDKNKFISIPFPSAFPTIANTSYLVCVESFGNVIVGTSGISDPQTSFVYYGSDATWYYTTNTPMVRMNFDPVLSTSTITKENASVNVYPNPAKDKVSVDFSLNNDTKVSINVTDLAGKVIFSNNLGNKASGQHTFTLDASAFSNGIYVMNVVTNGEVNAHKLVINK